MTEHIVVDGKVGERHLLVAVRLLFVGINAYPIYPVAMYGACMSTREYEPLAHSLARAIS